MINTTKLNSYARMFGTILIILGLIILTAGALGGLGFKVYQMVTHGQIPLAIFISGISCIVVGYIIRFIFRIRQ